MWRGLMDRPKVLLLAVWIFSAVIVALWIDGTTQAGRGSPTGSTPITREIILGQARSGRLYEVTVSIKDPSQLQGSNAVHVLISDARGEVAAKCLHDAGL